MIMIGHLPIFAATTILLVAFAAAPGDNPANNTSDKSVTTDKSAADKAATDKAAADKAATAAPSKNPSSKRGDSAHPVPDADSDSSYNGGRLDVTGTITVTCTSGTVYHIGLNAGNTPGSTITNRQMFGGNGGQNFMAYQLFSDAARTINWGDSAGTNWVTGTGNGAAQPYTIYARIPSLQSTPSGSYTDTITASVTGSFATATAQFSVTATDVPGCGVDANDLAFGGYTGALINRSSLIAVVCTSGTKFEIGLDAGTAPGATVTNRSMTGPGGALLGYKLFQDASRTQNWGNTPGVDTVSGSGNGRSRVSIVWGQLPGGQSAPAGAYSDTITVTITY